MVVRNVFVRGCIGPVALTMFVDTDNPLAHNNCLAIFWSNLKSEQKLYV